MINEITCKHYLTLKNCTPITALACQLAEALGPVCNRIYYVLLESHLGMWPCYQTSDTLSFPPPQALLSTHSRRFWAEFPSRRFWLVTMLRTVPQSNLQKHSGEQASHSGWAMWFTKLTPSHMTSKDWLLFRKQTTKSNSNPPHTSIFEATASRNGSEQF